MIPKIIHYCWFGKSPMDKKAQKCIKSWKKFFPDYTIKECLCDAGSVRRTWEYLRAVLSALAEEAET